MRMVYIFAGQGAQHVGMGTEIADRHEGARELYSRASAVLGFDLLELCRTGPPDFLQQTENAQPAILVTSLACLAAAHNLPRPVAAAGLSLGEYTALVAAGALALEDAVMLVHRRGIFMREATAERETGMLAVTGLDDEQVEALCQEVTALGVCQLTNYNAAKQVVIGGDALAVKRAAELASDAGALAIHPLAVSGAFHTSLMQPAAERLKEALRLVPISDPAFPIICNVTGKLVQGADEIRRLLVEHVVSPVRWEQSIRSLAREGADTFVEFGPTRTLSRLIKKTARKAQVLNIQDEASLKATLAAVMGPVERDLQRRETPMQLGA